ncbi:MORN repeat protein [Kordia periserrulae]|uniref:MORN repeat protein n=1 Tax=Kordia periserrulae TaxID=701523 RepID=A0A2T6C707_9FLAO|nr:hypothetical protein [Kordia periserrulae]PTX64075.1 MORN repeat protein [Kordia periserrulae]
MRFVCAFVLIVFLIPQKRIINASDFDYEFYISSEKLKKPKNDKTYFWFKSGKIHQSKADVGGFVLVDEFTKYYKSKQLAEKGTFSDGLKDGVWRSWHENGTVATVETWKNGYRHGDFVQFAKNGNTIEEGRYRNHQKHGTWIQHISQDTLRYKKGVVIPKKEKDTVQKVPFLKRIFKRKKKKKEVIKDSIHDPAKT